MLKVITVGFNYVKGSADITTKHIMKGSKTSNKFSIFHCILSEVALSDTPGGGLHELISRIPEAIRLGLVERPS